MVNQWFYFTEITNSVAVQFFGKKYKIFCNFIYFYAFLKIRLSSIIKYMHTQKKLTFVKQEMCVLLPPHQMCNLYEDAASYYVMEVHNISGLFHSCLEVLSW